MLVHRAASAGRAAIPLMPSSFLAASAIGVGFLSIQSMLSNVALLPLDLFGGRCAGFTNSLIASTAAGSQVLVSPMIGAFADRYGFAGLCLAMPAPILALAVLQWSMAKSRAAPELTPVR